MVVRPAGRNWGLPVVPLNERDDRNGLACAQLMASVGAHLNLDQVTLDIECPMEDSQNIDIVVWLDEVSYPVVSVKKYSDFAWVDELVPLPDLGMILE